MKRLFPMLLAGLLLGGCATLNEQKKAKTFDETMFIYEKAVRWSDFYAARQFQRLPIGTANPQIDPAQLKVTAYRQVNARRLAGDEEVAITVQIDYYRNDTMRVHTLTDEQVWRYDDEAGAWYITTPLPAFR